MAWWQQGQGVEDENGVINVEKFIPIINLKFGKQYKNIIGINEVKKEDVYTFLKLNSLIGPIHVDNVINLMLDSGLLIKAPSLIKNKIVIEMFWLNVISAVVGFSVSINIINNNGKLCNN